LIQKGSCSNAATFFNLKQNIMSDSDNTNVRITSTSTTTTDGSTHYNVTDSELREGIQEIIEQSSGVPREVIIPPSEPSVVAREILTRPLQFAVPLEMEAEEDEIAEVEELFEEPFKESPSLFEQPAKKAAPKKKSTVTYGRDVEMNWNDIVIQKSSAGIQVDHCSNRNSKKIKLLEQVGESGYIANAIQDTFYFDKNMNHLTVDHNTSKNLDVGSIMKGEYSRIKPQMIMNVVRTNHNTRFRRVGSYIVIDKKKFIESKGEKLSIKRKQNVPYDSILKMKKRFTSRFAETARFMDHMKTIVGSIYDEENFEIIFGLNFGNLKTVADFYIYVRFPDVTITNSIEMERFLGDMYIRLRGTYDSEGKYRIKSKIDGMRGTFTPLDRVVNFSHSHISKNDSEKGFCSFCIGGENHMFVGNSTGNYDKLTTDLELESILLSTQDFISWESLEGGPYNKMEDIKIHGEELPQRLLLDHNGYRSDRLRNELTSVIFRKNNLAKLKPCFTLVKEGNHAKYIVDKPLFFKTYLSLFREGELSKIIRDNDTNAIMYNSTTNSFHKSSVKTLGSWDEIRKKAREKIANTNRIIYMNGKHHRPILIKTNEEPDTLMGTEEGLDPTFLVRISAVIAHHLTTQLIKNER
jgi:hypothetical protein